MLVCKHKQKSKVRRDLQVVVDDIAVDNAIGTLLNGSVLLLNESLEEGLKPVLLNLLNFNLNALPFGAQCVNDAHSIVIVM